MTAPDDLLVATAREVLGDLVASGAARPDDGEWAAKAWSVLVTTGLTDVGVPEAAGGAGGTAQDAAAILGLCGELSVPLPLAEHGLLAGFLASSAGLVLPTGGGLRTVAPGHPDDTLTVEVQDAGWRVSGMVNRVPWAGAASHVLALAPVADEAGGHVVVLLDQGCLDTVPGHDLAGERRDAVLVSSTVLDTTRAARSSATPDDLRRLGAVTRAVLMAGALRRALDLTARYASERTQFGRPIAAFQAVGHQVARLGEESALADTAAALGVASTGAGSVDAGVAKSVCGRAAGAGARLAHQVHGAIGVTSEYELQRVTRRLLSWRDEHGSEGSWERAMGAALLGAGSGAAWDTVVGALPSLPATDEVLR